MSITDIEGAPPSTERDTMPYTLCSVEEYDDLSVHPLDRIRRAAQRIEDPGLVAAVIILDITVIVGPNSCPKNLNEHWFLAQEFRPDAVVGP